MVAPAEIKIEVIVKFSGIWESDFEKAIFSRSEWLIVLWIVTNRSS